MMSARAGSTEATTSTADARIARRNCRSMQIDPQKLFRTVADARYAVAACDEGSGSARPHGALQDCDRISSDRLRLRN